MSLTKNSLRKFALDARVALGEESRAIKSAAIVQWLHNWEPYCRGRHICLYASFGSEAGTEGLAMEVVAASQEPKADRSFNLPREPEGKHVFYLPRGFDGKRTFNLPQAPDGRHVFYLPRVDGEALAIHRFDPAAAAMVGDLAGDSSAAADDLSSSEAVGDLSSAAAADHLTGGGAAAGDLISKKKKGGWSRFAGLVRSPMGMWEPPATLPAVEPQLLDVIIVPGSAFCVQSGHRLGYGRGFYDRLLARAPQALKVGIGFDVQMFDVDSFPCDLHDIALDALVSESGIRDLRQGGR